MKEMDLTTEQRSHHLAMFRLVGTVDCGNVEAYNRMRSLAALGLVEQVGQTTSFRITDAGRVENEDGVTLLRSQEAGT